MATLPTGPPLYVVAGTEAVSSTTNRPATAVRRAGPTHSGALQHPALLRTEILRHKIPVDQIPPRGDVGRSSILVIQIIGVLPDITGEQRRLAVTERAASVGGSFDA